MALGILEPPVEHVPGTVNVYEAQEKEEERLRTNSTLKRDKSGKIILNPQPSDDPNDPLNWPLWKRDMIFGILNFVAVIATTAAPILAADSVLMTIYFKPITFGDAANLTAFHLAGAAVGAVVAVPFARKFGKRGIFLFATLLMTASSAWAGSTHNTRNYHSFLWARIFQGVALAPFESLVNAVVGDLYFVNERGPRMAIATVCLFGGAFMTPVVAGAIVANPSLGWQWTFYFLAIFMGAGFFLLFFFVPETTYNRASYLETDVVADEYYSESGSSSVNLEAQSTNEKQIRATTVDVAVPTEREPYWRQLLPFSGVKTEENYLKLLLRPFPLFLHPTIVWGCLLQGVVIGWTVMVGVIIAFVFYGPPLFFTEERTGKLYVAAFIGAIVGLVFSGVYTETVTRFMVRRNKGKYEPEFRILLVLPTMVFTAVGLYGFGITAADVARYGWLIPDVFVGFICCSMVTGAIASAQYVLDAHREIAVEAFTALIIFKNLYSFVLAYKAFSWIFKSGVKHMFTIFGSIEVAVCLLSIPMYVFGKYNRAILHKYDIFKMCGLR